jgi:hypothetical protein
MFLQLDLILYDGCWGGGVGGCSCGWASLVVGLLILVAAAGWRGLWWGAGGLAWCVGSGVGLGWGLGCLPSLVEGFLAI